MLCSTCQVPARRVGHDRHGRQRYRCPTCRRTFYSPEDALRPDGRRLSENDVILCLRLLLEGNSIRSTERLTGVEKKTIIRIVVQKGALCQQFMGRVAYKLAVEDVQCDEIWGYVGCKERTRERLGQARRAAARA